MKSKIFQRSHCRICNSTNLTKVLSFEKMPLTEDFVSQGEIGSEFLADNNIYFCQDCHTVQTQHDVDFTEYYKEFYQYSVGQSPTASRFMEAISSELVDKYFQGAHDLKVLEIGSGDGGQLLPFKRMGCQVLGYEPSSKSVEVAQKQGIPTIQGLFDKNSINNLPEEFKTVDIILLSYTFDHLPEPVEFLRTARSILNPQRGVLVVEVHNLERIFERREFCLFEHEHSIYLTRATAQSLLEQEGFTAINFDIVPETIRRANSLIFVATPSTSELQSLRVPPVNLPEYSQLGFYQEKAKEITQGIENLDNFVSQVIQRGETIAGYGAGGRGVATLAAMNQSHQMSYLIDKNPHGENLYTPKSNLPIFGLEKLQESPVDHLLVFSFGYMNEIKQDLKRFGYQPKQAHSMIDITQNKGYLK